MPPASAYNALMPRPPRIQFPGAIYHLTSRGNNRQAIFLDDADRTAFLDLLSRSRDRFNFRIFAFCLMTNHYHLFLRTPEPNLAVSLQWLNSTYSARFNRRHHRSGHLFQGRYQAVLIVDEAHWFHLSMYLHLNPVRAGLVDDPADYEWSSFRDFTRAKSRYPWLAADEVLAGYGSSGTSSRRHYRQECLGLAGRPANFWEEIRNKLLSDTGEFIKKWAGEKAAAGNGLAVPIFRNEARAEVDPPAELRRVEEIFGQAVESSRRGRKGSLARLAAYYHLVEHCGASVSQTAKWLGVVPSSVSQGLARFTEKVSKDRDLRKKVEALAKL